MKERADSKFLDLLKEFTWMKIEEHDSSVYGLWPDFRLAYFNPAWVRFAQDNAGDPLLWSPQCLGTSVMDVTPRELKPFYQDSFSSCLEGYPKNRKPLQHEYECSSADVYRKFNMTLYSLKGSAGLLVVNSLLIETANQSKQQHLEEFNETDYVDTNGLIHQCAHCRKIQHMESMDRWDWIPAWVKEIPENTSHGICPICFDHYYL